MTKARLRTLHLTAFVAPFLIFTTLLLVPRPLPEQVTRRLDFDLQYIINKSAHMGGFAYLTAVGFLYPRITLNRWLMVAFVASHGILTEVGQTFVPNRSGSVKDVLIDWVGVALGVMVGLVVLRWTGRFFRGE